MSALTQAAVPPQAPIARPGHEQHTVQFYDGDVFLADRVAAFLAAGLEGGGAAMVVATASHRAAIAEALSARGIDVASLRGTGQLRLLDADSTLASLTVDGMPNAARVDELIAPVIAQALARFPAAPARIFGEMVDLLWRRGETPAALHLEGLWNGLQQRYAFLLLCAYALDGFASTEHGDGFGAVCALHDHVLPTESYLQAPDAEAQLREIGRLQQRARSLEVEIERREALERELRQSREELVDFFENAAEGLHRVAADGTILWANRAELEMLGYAHDEYVGRHITEFHVDQPVIQQMLAELCSGATLRDREARLRCKDGSVKDVVINSNALFRDGKLVHTRCFTRDVTERKRMEEALRAANSAKDEFIAMLGHELRNPLAPIVTSLQLMNLRLGDVAAKERAIIERQVKHLSRLMDDLLDVARLTRGKTQLHRAPVELAEIVADAIEIASPVIEQRRHALEIDIPRTGLRVDADRHRLAQAIANLLTNAAKYTDPNGRIALTAEATAAGTAAAPGGEVVLHVRDTGMGIAADLLPRLFDVFVQGAQDLDRARGGLGVGLALVRSLVELHGGTVEAESAGPGQGSAFTVRLPRLS